MKHELEPGYYVITRKGRVFSNEHAEILIVTTSIENGKRVKYFQFNNGIPERVNSDDEDYQLKQMKIVKILTDGKPLKYKKAKIIVPFEDQEGLSFEMTACDLPMLIQTMINFPGLFKHLMGDKIRIEELAGLIKKATS